MHALVPQRERWAPRAWHAGAVKHSEFRQALEETFGPAYGRTLATELVLVPLGNRTPEQALADGVAPREVWDAVCVEMELDERVRWRHRGTLDPRRR